MQKMFFKVAIVKEHFFSALNLPPPKAIPPSVPTISPSVPMDDFWDDGIEDALLIEASQSAETKVKSVISFRNMVEHYAILWIVYSQITSQERDVNSFKHSERDLAELTRMLEDDEDWEIQVPNVPVKEKCLDQSKTIFHQQVGK